MDAKVLIVGAGIAGIKAALELEKAGIDYFIIEAKKQLGGRLKTVQGINGKYDLGASWFHETLNNALFDEENAIALKSGGSMIHYYDDSPVKVMNSNGVISGSMKLESIINEIQKYVEIWHQSDLEREDESFHNTVVRYLKDKKHLLTDDQLSNALERIRSLELWHGIDILRMSSKYASIDNEGRDAFALHYDEVLKRHVDQLNMCCVMVDSVAKSITKKKDEDGVLMVEVTTHDGETYSGEYVIVTVPQSILQLKDPSEEAYIEFQPKLPKRITEALDKIHFGALGKVVFEFEEIFWPMDSERILVLADPPKDFLNSIKSDKPILPEFANPPKNWEFPILFLNQATSFNKPTLIALTQSPLTEYFESNPDLVWDFYKPTIQHIACKTDIPSPNNLIVTDWTVDPFQKGSYSACYPGDDPLTAILALEEGFGNIRFAGEHTILEGAGCVHGAWNSGKREAKYIIDQIKN